jgi:hypothetical protein
MPDGTVQIRVRDGFGGYSGLMSCGSPWACPVCNAKIAQRRMLETGVRIAAGFSQGHAVAFLTHTTRHNAGDRLTWLLDGLNYGWGSMTSGRFRMRLTEEFGLIGYQRSLEITYGVNGWHPHYHSLWFGAFHTVEQVEDFGYNMFAKHEFGIRKAGLSGASQEANHWRLVTPNAADIDIVAQYLQKMADPFGIGFEMTTTQSKTARKRHSTRPHWSLLPGAINGETPDIWLWHEFEKATRGRKQMVKSKHLDQKLGVELLEVTDEDLAAEEMGTQDDALVVISADGWSVLVRDVGLMTHALKIAPLGQQFLSTWLTSNGVEHWRIS